MECRRTKAALKRRPGYPIGTPAPMYLSCLCREEVDVPEHHTQVAQCRKCGTVYDHEGWILDDPHQARPD